MASLMNGLSSLGQGVSAFAGTAALEQQKSDLAKQSAILADSLATTRESAGRVQAGDIAAKAATQAQGATAANIATEQSGAMARTQATINAPTEAMKNEAGGVAAIQAARATAAKMAELQETARLSAAAPTPEMKMLDAVLGPGWRQTATNTTAAPSSASTPSTNSAATPPDSGVSGAASATPSATAPSVTGDQNSSLATNIINHALGLPQAGSDAAIRSAIAQDVNADPKFKGATVGQKAAEIESRLAVAGGKMTDPASRESMAKGIASYQIAPLANFALTKSGGPETMARVMELNPDFQDSRYPEVNKAMSAFGSGKQGDTVRSLNVGVQHLDLLDAAASALNNNNVQVLNTLKNAFQQQFGMAAPTTFEGLKQIVGTEIEKAVSGGIGAVADRDRLMKALDRANSPAQLMAMTDGFRGLMVGQLNGLKNQYEDATGFKNGPFAFETKLIPATTKALGLHSGTASPANPTGPIDDTSGASSGGANSTLPPLPPGFRVIQ